MGRGHPFVIQRGPHGCVIATICLAALLAIHAGGHQTLGKLWGEQDEVYAQSTVLLAPDVVPKAVHQRIGMKGADGDVA